MFKVSDKVILRSPVTEEDEKTFQGGWYPNMLSSVGKEAKIEIIFKQGASCRVFNREERIDFVWDTRFLDLAYPLVEELKEEDFCRALLDDWKQ